MAKVGFIGELAQQAGVGVQTIRYYERLGLLRPPQRTPAGYRLFPPEAVERITFIKKSQALGLSLQEIKEILRLKYSGQSPCDCVRTRLEQRLKQIETEMRRLAVLRREVQECLRGTRHLPRLPHTASLICPIIESQRTSKRSKGGEKR